MKKIFLLIILLFFLTGCATQENLVNNNISQKKDLLELKFNEVKTELNELNLNYYNQSCNGTVSKEKYQTCLNLYSQIKNLTKIHNEIINGTYNLENDKNINKNQVNNSEKINNEIEEKLNQVSINYENKIEEDKKTNVDNSLYVEKYIVEYDNKNYNIKINLSKNKYQTYSSYEREYSYYYVLPENWEEDYYKMFVFDGDDDEVMEQIINQIKNINKNMDKDELLKAVISFVQYIPYNWDGYYSISDSIQYPYEILVKKKGVCADKTVLLAKLLSGLDYKVGIFIFENADHAAIGIGCPDGYDDYDSGYCFIETTDINPIGHIPDSYGINGDINLDSKPKILNIANGNLYNNIVFDKQEQEDLIDKYGEEYFGLDLEEKELYEKITNLEEEYDNLGCEGTVSESKYRKCIKIYNKLNPLIEEYNEMVVD